MSNHIRPASKLLFLRHAFIMLVSNIGMTLLGLLTGVVLARTLGPTGRGLMTTVFIWPQMLVWVSGLSLSYASVYYGSADSAVRKHLFANSFWAAIVLGSITGGLSVVILPHFVSLDQSQHTLLLFALLTLPLGLWTDYAYGLLQCTSRFERLGFVRIMSPLLTAVCLLVLWGVHSLTVTSAVLSYWGGAWFQFAWTIRFLVQDGCVSFRPDIALLRKSFSYSSRIHLGTLAGLANSRLDQLVMTGLVAPKALGLYAFSVILAETLRQTAVATTTVLYPKVSRETTDEQRRLLAAKTTRWVLMIAATGATALFILAPWVVPYVWGNRFAGAVPTLRVLLPGTVALSVTLTMATNLYGAGRPGVTTIAEVASLLVMLPLLWLWLPRLGIFGAGLASTCGYCVNCFVMTYYFTSTFGKECLFDIRPSRRDWEDIRTVFTQLRLRPQATIGN